MALLAGAGHLLAAAQHAGGSVLGGVVAADAVQRVVGGVLRLQPAVAQGIDVDAQQRALPCVVDAQLALLAIPVDRGSGGSEARAIGVLRAAYLREVRRCGGGVEHQ